jgi:hypothetical protein
MTDPTIRPAPGPLRPAPERIERRGPGGVGISYSVMEQAAAGGVPGAPDPISIDIPDAVLEGLPFASLDADLPLLLLPVQLETRLVLDADPPELRIRIYPDQVHIDSGVQSADAADGQAHARPVLLPGQWLALGYAGGTEIFRQASAPVASDLRVGPDAQGAVSDVLGGDLTIDDGLAWMLDYDRALDAGMAITVPLSPAAAAQARDKIDLILVVGVRAGSPQTVAEELARLLAVHAVSTGLAFIPQGTPTNTTSSTVAGTPSGGAAVLGGRASRPDRGAADDDAAGRTADVLGLPDVDMLRAVPHGNDPHVLWARWMREATFQAVFGTLAGRLLDVSGSPGLDPEVTARLRAWFVERVSGGAPVATLRIGSQPYGILPVRPALTDPDPSTAAGQVERVVALLTDAWRRSLELLPSPDFPDPDADPSDTAGAILAQQPHPARLFVRHLDEYAEGEAPDSIQAQYAAQLARMTAATQPDGNDPGVDAAGFYYTDLLASEYPDGFISIDDQIDLWTLVQSNVQNFQTGDIRDKGLGFVRQVLDTLGNFEERQRPLRWLGLERFAGILGENEDDTTLVAALLSAAATEWPDAGLVQAPDADKRQTARAYLADLADRFSRRKRGPLLGGRLPESELSRTISPKPLLYQLLDATLGAVPPDPTVESGVTEALQGLATVDPDTLAWLLRETLGLGAHRLDAWATSLASERLERLRDAHPGGVQVGAFAWVTTLEPRAAPRDSGGFIHASSMAHATTAALLRSGWETMSADDTSDAASPTAVDLRSDRIRTALWLSEGIRHGQPLGDLLGYRFERTLHDQDADDQIQPIRAAVLAAAGRPHARADTPVDGIALLELSRAGGLDTPSQAVVSALADLDGAFDAFGDVGLFEATHQLAAGNDERATAVLNAIGTGANPPPEFRAPLTDRSAVAVEHRVLVLLDPEAPAPGDGWVPGVRDAIAPALESWVASLLPPPRDVHFSAGVGSALRSLTLADLGLSALDAIHLVGEDPTVGAAPLRTLAAAALGSATPVTVEPTGADAGAVSLADFGVLAIEIRRLIGALRPADARDLRPASAAGDAGLDTGSALAAIDDVIGGVQQCAAALDGASAPDVRAEAVSYLARVGISTGGAPDDPDATAALGAVVDRRMANVDAATVDGADRQPGLEARLAIVLGRRLPLLGRFVVAGASGPDGAAPGPVVDVAAGPADATPDVLDDWLDAVGRARGGVGDLATVGLLSQLLGGAGLDLHAGQDPLSDGESWVGLSRPAGGGRLSVVATSGRGAVPSVADAACGLVVDRWSEPIPSRDQTTGVTFQFDAPGNRPPQAWLLAVTPDGRPWSLALVVQTLLETLEWAGLRTVGPEDLVDYGRSIPTTFVPGEIAAWPEGD